MRIAVSASRPELDAEVNPRFGRAPYFLLVHPGTLDFEVVTNQENLQTAHGAGIQTAALVAKCGPAAVITGNCGPKAYQTLKAAGIPVILGVSGTVRDAVQQYNQGKLAPAPAPNQVGHW
ncbi:MAG: NifB/NifX family molybdenum-iron cluster-binding protein [Desulfobaccales bacterium]